MKNSELLRFSRKHVDRTAFFNEQNCCWQSICFFSHGRMRFRGHFWWALNFHDLFVTRPLFCGMVVLQHLLQKKNQACRTSPLEDGFARIRALTELEIIPQRLQGNAIGFSADQQPYGKTGAHSKNALRKGVNIDAAGNTIIRLNRRTKESRPDQDQIYRVSLKVEGRTRHDMVIWDTVAVNEDRSNDPRYTALKS